MHPISKLAASAATGFLLSAGAVAPVFAASKPMLVFVTNGASDFWKAAAAGVKKAKKELPDFNMELKYPEQATVAAQQRLMDDLVTAGVKGIMVSAVDPKTSTDVLNKIAAETALFTTDSDAPQTKRIAYIGSSNVLAGKQAAEIAKKAMPDGGKCMGFVGLARRGQCQGAHPGLQGRHQGHQDQTGRRARRRYGPDRAPRRTSRTRWSPTRTSTAWSASIPTTRRRSMTR